MKLYANWSYGDYPLSGSREPAQRRVRRRECVGVSELRRSARAVGERWECERRAVALRGCSVRTARRARAGGSCAGLRAVRGGAARGTDDRAGCAGIGCGAWGYRAGCEGDADRPGAEAAAAGAPREREAVVTRRSRIRWLHLARRFRRGCRRGRGIPPGTRLCGPAAGEKRSRIRWCKARPRFRRKQN